VRSYRHTYEITSITAQVSAYPLPQRRALNTQRLYLIGIHPSISPRSTPSETITFSASNHAETAAVQTLFPGGLQREAAMPFFADTRLVQSNRRWNGRTLVASMLALALGGLTAGAASAQGLTVDTNFVFRGWVNIVQNSVPANATRLVYTVPANRSFLLTDLMISATGSSTAPARFQIVWTGTDASCNPGLHRTSWFTVGAGETIHIPFVSGIDFRAGQYVCVFNGDPVGPATYWTIRGFLFQ
jgi:hypothetical protein